MDLTPGIRFNSSRKGMRQSMASASKICPEPALEIKSGALNPVILSFIFCWNPFTIANVKKLTNIASAMLITEMRSTGRETLSP